MSLARNGAFVVCPKEPSTGYPAVALDRDRSRNHCNVIVATAWREVARYLGRYAVSAHRAGQTYRLVHVHIGRNVYLTVLLLFSDPPATETGSPSAGAKSGIFTAHYRHLCLSVRFMWPTPRCTRCVTPTQVLFPITEKKARLKEMDLEVTRMNKPVAKFRAGSIVGE